MSEVKNENLALVYDMVEKASNDTTNAKKYDDMILIEDSLSWEPILCCYLCFGLL